MDPARPSDHGRMSDPSAPAPGDIIRCPEPGAPPPRVDDRLAPPETRLEYLEGVEVFAAPADEPHGIEHAELTHVLRAIRADSERVAVDLLTRTEEASDFAPDASVYPSERDPETGGRRLEELAFEVASEQSIGVTTKKARELARRGVRRVFCILIKQRRVLEWSREIDGWRTMPESEVIEDPCLAAPLPIRALLDPAAADEAVVAGLLARGVPAIMQLQAESEAIGEAIGEARGEARGEATARAEALLSVLAARKILVDDATRAAVQRCTDTDQLKAWMNRAAVATTPEEVFEN